MTGAQLELREVPGPSATGGGWKRSLDLLYLMASTEFKRTYFGTVLGYLWSLCRPLLLFAVLLVVFTHLLRFSTVAHYPVLLLMNIVLFSFFSEGTNAAVPSVVSNEGVVRKTQFPRLVIPLSVVLTSLFNLALNLIVVFIFMLASGVSPRWSWLLMPVLVGLLLLLTASTAMILSALYPRFRDVGIIWSVVSTALFYATPVLYPLDRLHGLLHDLVALNPLTPILELARRWIIGPPAPVAHSPLQVLVPLALYVLIPALGIWVFRREAPRIAEAL